MVENLLHVVGAWGVFGIMVAILLGFSIFFTVYYSSARDREPFAMIITILALTLCLSTVTLFPIDIFLVSRTLDPATGLRRPWATDEVIASMQLVVSVVYYVAYGLIASFCFFWIPLAYFYFEEFEEDQTVQRRLMASLKYTAFFIVIACILLVTGLFIKPNDHDNRDLEWLRKILAALDGPGALAFVAGVLSIIGMLVLVFYTAPGLSLLPMHLLAGYQSISAKVNETNAELIANRERLNAIRNRYPPTSNCEISERDRLAINELEREELILESRSRMVQRTRDSWANKCHWIVRPFEIVLGLAATTLTILLITSIAITTLDNLKEEGCGAPCGYILTHPNLPNPLNLLFLELSPFFPVDYILMLMIILYMFWATTKGIISIGIRFLWVNLYKFRRAATQPQGLLAATMLLMLSLTGMYYSLTMTVAPDYSMFGSQKYCNHTITNSTRDCSDYPTLIIPCHIGAPIELCTPTVTSSIVLKIILGTPGLGIAFYYTQWLLLLVFVGALVFNLVQGCRHGFGVDPALEDGEDMDDIESRGLSIFTGNCDEYSLRMAIA
ncbi:hypothetical protein BCR41DRAFT_360490 [Lobosporangium transversale]|uniref:Probable lysosomal cobalamin transporter n=1 Tax=Lobosporangium transversale TaxID=64571 RepID=A0A1Y2GCH0_9FUNG|nr:hypothetical protein BCR41DRAFT_360490 [Lobosporangium transversale]ORZ07018.1 hypothetical protein BCR41DRAFT_360490 [Lobosporangium transversale]|eukprot:XP_021877814.1 hypothetical protein BCR41DRAFT_360490 [Lobosporangium transversale]